MESIQIDSGEIELRVNGDENRIIKFNPSNLLFIEKYYKLIKEKDELFRDYEARAVELDKHKEKDSDGLLVNTPERLEFCRDLCNALNTKIDNLFGEGTAQAAFGDVIDYTILQEHSKRKSVYEQFFLKISPYIQQEREKEIAPYLISQKPAKGARAKPKKPRKRK